MPKEKLAVNSFAVKGKVVAAVVFVSRPLELRFSRVEISILKNFLLSALFKICFDAVLLLLS